MWYAGVLGSGWWSLTRARPQYEPTLASLRQGQHASTIFLIGFGSSVGARQRRRGRLRSSSLTTTFVSNLVATARQEPSQSVASLMRFYCSEATQMGVLIRSTNLPLIMHEGESR
jgi:hypothetical protein